MGVSYKAMQIGLERLLKEPRKWLGHSRAGLVANPTTVIRDFRHAIDLINALPQVQLVRLFGPEHGLRGAAQYMVEVDHEIDPICKIPVISLYGKTEESLAPRAEDLKDIDVLIFDIQDVGARYYTYQATMALCMRVASRSNTTVLVLDRPNPIGGAIEGSGIVAGLENFCGIYPIPQRHGLTVGELAHLYNQAFGIGCDLQVVPCAGWSRDLYYDQTNLPWIMPSPNMPTVDTALVYPGMCLIEGTNISEGRGTTKPFELFGAPFIDPYKLRTELSLYDLPGVIFRPCAFQPTFDKFAHQHCGALQLHITDRSAFLPYRTGLAILHAVRKLWPNNLLWRQDTYEFRNDVPAIDLLTGDPEVRQGIDAQWDFEKLISITMRHRKIFDANYQKALLY